MGKRWIQFAAAVVAMIMIANLQYSWTLFVKPLAKALNQKDIVAVQWAGTLFLIFETWVTPVEGWLIDRLGPRIFLSIGGVLVGIGWTSMGFVHSIAQLYVMYAIAGIGAAFIYSGSVATALKWFPDKRGTVSGNSCTIQDRISTCPKPRERRCRQKFVATLRNSIACKC